MMKISILLASWIAAICCTYVDEKQVAATLSPATEAGYIYFLLSPDNPSEWVNVFKDPFDLNNPQLVRLEKGKKELDSIYSTSPLAVSIGSIGRKCYENNYTLFPGDSILLHKDCSRQGYIQIRNRKVNDLELNFSHHLNKNRIGINRYYFQEMVSETHEKKRLPVTAEKSYQASIAYADSLLNKKLVSDVFAQEIKHKLTLYYLTYKISSKQTDTGFLRNDLFIHALSNPDTLVGSHAGRQFLVKYANSRFFMPPGGDMDLYDQIVSRYHGKSRSLLLYNYLDKLGQENKKLFQKYYIRFLNDCPDEQLRKNITGNYVTINKSGSKKAILQSMSNDKLLSYESILQTNKGKVIYVDLWASWCGPCLAVMPEAQKLREKYDNTKITFVYVAMDKRKMDWKNALGKALLTDQPASYLLLEPDKNELVTQFKITSIPRYLLYDKKGVLVSANAPGPAKMLSNNMIGKLIDEP